MSNDPPIERAIDEAPIGITIADARQPDEPLIYLNDAFERLTGYPEEETVGVNCRFLQGENTEDEPVAAMREAIANEEPVSVELRNYRKDGTEFWNKVDIAPIREEGETTHFVGFQTDVTARKEAEFEIKRRIEEVEREREKLERVLERIDGLLEDVTQALVHATTRDGVARTACRRLTDDDAYDAAWIGERVPTTDEIVPEAWAGTRDLSDVTLPIDSEGDPTARALVTGTARFVSELDEARSWHEEIRDRTVRAIAAIPLIAGETTHGVLTVYARQNDAFDEHERVVLKSIGRAIASTFDALESRRILTVDTAVELDFSLGEEDLFFVGLSESAGCRLSYEGTAHDGDSLAFFTVYGADPETVRDLARRTEGVEDAILLTAGETSGLFEFRLGETSLITRLAKRGVRIRSMTAAEGEGHVRVVVPAGVRPRSIVEAFSESCPTAELVARREHERPPQTDAEYRLSVEERLTDRQLLALRKAYVSGYFDPQRRATGSELAASMGISRSTFHQHLRAAQRKILDEFFDRGIPD